VQTDGYVGYDFLDHEKEIHHVGCWVHAHPMKYIKRLHKLEKNAGRNEFTSEEIYPMRQNVAKPILRDFKK